MWENMKKVCLYFRKEDKCDCSVSYLSKADKRSLWYGAFIMSMFIVGLCCFAIAISNIRVSRENSEDMEKLIKMLATYIGSATQNEYDEIAKSIRHDLVFSEYGQEIDDFIQYIPNTAEDCSTCAGNFISQAYLICTNTGETYGLDLFEKGENPEIGDYNYTGMSFGYDEVSQTSIVIRKVPGQWKGVVSIRCGKGIVSVQRMKALFCDECIRRILNIIEKQLIEEFFIFDAEQKLFYPIESGDTVCIGNYELKIEYRDNFEIAIEYIKE